jgi:geranylgeranyl diphosphate synthase type II
MGSSQTVIDEQPGFKAMVNQAMIDFCDNKITQTATIGHPYTQLWQEIKAYLMGGGKRIRPELCMEAYRGYGGIDDAKVIGVATAWELLHSSLLVIDDIIDRDTVRHGQPNIAGAYSNRYAGLREHETQHYALSAALLGGSLLLVTPYEIINQSQLSSSHKTAMISFFQQALFEVGGGEHIEVVSVLGPVEETDTRAVIRYKTSGYSFILPMQSGARLAGASDKELTLIKQLGEHLGLVFQLGDDLLGVFGDTTQTGKPTDSDIREKKRTLLIQRALTHLNQTEATFINTCYNINHPMTSKEATRIHTLIAKTPARDELFSEINENAAKARILIKKLDASLSFKTYLDELLDKLIGRTA